MSNGSPPFNPFPGLRPFSTEEKHLFFGREEQTAELLARLRRTRFLAAIGPSGSGKSSLVRAGVLPELYGGTMVKAGSKWHVIIMRPGGSPISNLAAALREGDLYDAEEEDVLAWVKTTLLRSGLGLADAVRQSQLPTGTNLLLVVDQFEEMFRFGNNTSHDREEASAFVNLLLEASRQPDQRIYIVLTMRSDFLGDCAQYRGLAEAINEGEYLIPRLSRDQWRSAIQGPVRVGGGEIAPRLVQRLLNDVGENPDQLPILQHALMRAWEFWAAHRHGAEPIDLVHYEAIGGMADALSRHADEAYFELQTDRSREIVKKSFQALTENGPDNRGIRRPTRMSDLLDILEIGEEELLPVLECFRKAGRSFLMPPPDVLIQRSTVIDISHESLMRVWGRLQKWVEEESQSARIYRRLAETALLEKEHRAGLYRDPDLQIGLIWRDESKPTAAWGDRYHPGFKEAMDFLEKSRKARDADKQAKEAAQRRELEQAKALAAAEKLRAEEQARSAARLRVFVSVLAILTILTILFAVRANHQKKLATSGKLSESAIGQLSIDPELSILLSMEAINVAASPRAYDVLRQSLFESHVRATLRGHTQSVAMASFSPDGKWIVTASDDDTARVWAAESGHLVARLIGHMGDVRTASFSSNSQWLVTASVDKTARLWETSTGKSVAILAHEKDVRSAFFSPDDRYVLTASEDGSAGLWDWKQSSAPPRILRHEGPVNSVQFSHNGNLIATASSDKTVKVWRSPAGELLHVLTNHVGAVNSAVFSPDDQSIVTASDDKRSLLWDFANDRVREVQASDSKVKGAVFSPDGRFLLTRADDKTARILEQSSSNVVELRHSHTLSSAIFGRDSELVLTASADKAARVWNRKDGSQVAVLRGHEEQVNSAAFHPGGTSFVTAARDRTARVWESRAGERLLPKMDAQTESTETRLSGIALSQDGNWAGMIDEHGASIWNLRTGTMLRSIKSEEEFSSIALSPDAKSFLTTIGSNAIVTLVATGEANLISRGSTGLIGQGAFSPDGRFILTAGQDGRLRLWDVNDGRQLAALQQPGPVAHAGFSREGRHSFTVSRDLLSRDLCIRVISWPGQKLETEIKTAGLGSDIQSAALSPDGKLIGVAFKDAVVRLWGVEKRTLLMELRGHTESVNAIDFSPDSRFILTAGADYTARIWSPRTGNLLATFRGHTDYIKNAIFTRDGRSIVTASRDGMVRSYSCPECCSDDELVRLARQRITRNLTAAEKSRYLSIN